MITQRIALERDSKYAPCGYIVCLVDDDGHWDMYSDDTSKTILVDSDWGFPGLASTFGWSPCCGAGQTDGTVDCLSCGAKTGDLISSAADFLDDHLGTIVEDPGYFSS